MKIATWNVNSLNVRLGHVVDWLADNPVDVLAIQETKLVDEKFPHEALAEAGWQSVAHGQKTYNGVALVAREAPADVVRGLSDEQARVIAGTVGGVRVINCYCPNGQEVGSEKYAYKLAWFAELRALVAAELERYPELVVLGDFNVAPTPEDTHDPTAWEGRILCSEPEREALQELLAVGLSDPFDSSLGPEERFTWWDYRAAGFRRNLGLRIDHVLLSAPLAARDPAWVCDKAPRRWERPSDHAPVVVTLGA